MTAVSLCTIVLALLGSTPGETAGWGTGSVNFVAHVTTAEHQEIYPMGTGKYTVEANILQVIDDPFGVLVYKTNIEIYYNTAMGLKSGDTIDVTGTFNDGASAIPYIDHVIATYIFRNDNWEEPVPGEPPDPLVWPSVTTGSASATETTVTMQGKLVNDGGFSCRCRFIYQECAGAGFNFGLPVWSTAWSEGMRTGATLGESVAALKPATRYFYRMEVENEWANNYGVTGTFVTLTETVPPIPYPAIWSAEPDQVDTTTITMTAGIERDLTGPIEYAFDFVESPTGGAGGSGSQWLFTPTFMDVGLNTNHQYGYRVKARDGNGNDTAYSATRYAYTDIETPTDVTFGEITTSSIKVSVAGTFSGLTRGQSGLKLENVTAGQVSAWQQDNSPWLSSGLLPNTSYAFRAQARNGDGDPTPFCEESSVYTLAAVPGTVTISQGPNGQLIVRWAANGNPTGTQYWCQNTVTNSNSGWINGTQWFDTGLSPNTKYGYKVKARNGDNVETVFSAVVQAYSAIETPTGVVFGATTTTTLQVKADGTVSGLDRDNSGLLFENITTGQTSGWRHDNTYWTSDGLQPNQPYELRVRARNGDGEPTSFSIAGYVYTQAMIPGTATVSANGRLGQLSVSWSANGNPAGTQYWCQNTVTNANSGWTTSTEWVETGLSANTKYGYKIKARNGDGVETAFSATVQGYSIIETPTAVSFGTPGPTTIQVKAKNTPSGLDRDNSGLLFENITTGQTSTWRHDNAFWTSDSLLPNRSYGFRVRARNGDAVATSWSDSAYIYTYANPPTAGSFTGITSTSIQVQWGVNGNPAGTMYMCENTTSGAISGWITDTAWDNVSLQPNTPYTYRVKARNGDGVDTAWVTLGTQSTDYRSLTVSATTGGQVSAPGLGTFRYAPGATATLTAAPVGGYHFLCWTGTAVDAGRVTDVGAAQTTVLVDAHYTLVANFLRTKMYVDGRSPAGGDGSTWQKAFTYLQDALDAAQPGNEICVAQGTYKPDMGKNVVAGDRTASFNLPSGVRLKGGYVGIGAADAEARDITVYPTVFSGDLKSDDKAVTDLYDLYSDFRRTDNSLHVVTAWEGDSETLLEGVTIIGGNGGEGAGLFIYGGGPVLSQCTIRANRSGHQTGDGLAGWGTGAGVSCYASEPSFVNCLFQSNWSGYQGGALCSIESKPSLVGCAFRLNQAGLQGGALYTEDSNAVLVGCVFHGNNAGDGGALYAGEGSDARLTHCSFFGNAAGSDGGAVFSAGRDLRFINNVFSANLALVSGGGIALTHGSAILTNCTLSRNYCEQIKNGQALAITDAVAVLTNCIVWDQAGSLRAPIAITGTAQNIAEVIASYSHIALGADGVVRKGNVTVSWGSGNIALDLDPRFVSPAGVDKIAGTEDDNLRLQAVSPCLDAGNNTAVPEDMDDVDADANKTERVPFDLAGQPRFVDRAAVVDTGLADPPTYKAIVDLGAYELPAQ